jgi:ZIP family zinc transporter
MNELIFTALMVGGATIFGGGVGLVFKKTTKAFTDAVLSFAAGVMLAAAFIGLIIPSIEYGGVFVTVVGIFAGALLVNFLDLLIPIISSDEEKLGDERLRRVFLFVMAIALHNLPEGIAAGVGLGAGEVSDGILIAAAIALQNVPEGLIVTVSMLGAGVKPYQAFLISALTGVIEIFGTFLGFYAVGISSTLLPLILALAGGTMLYVISEEMIPETHSDDSSKLSTYFLLGGFCLILIFDALI